MGGTVVAKEGNKARKSAPSQLNRELKELLAEVAQLVAVVEKAKVTPAVLADRSPLRRWLLEEKARAQEELVARSKADRAEAEAIKRGRR